MKNRGPGPHVAWAGVVVRLDDGTVHAVEFTDGFITADLKLPGVHLHGRAASVWIQGYGRYWQQGADIPVPKQGAIEAVREVES